MLVFQANVTTHHAWWKGLTLGLLHYVGLVASTALNCMQSTVASRKLVSDHAQSVFPMVSGLSKCKRLQQLYVSAEAFACPAIPSQGGAASPA